jgi:hypothetical protein
MTLGSARGAWPHRWVDIHSYIRHSGRGLPVVLLHAFPEFWYAS